ncbi:histidine kinase [Hydrogenophaga crassostreae]|uniref:Histidine kinase n=1 Tax=Hydrogenophaga crassostreae TaxID=1763535 RepID=A0A167I1W7_9BURK|nr:helix-turn-helix domain-containing protein [Hydrogenophaga crassostreae]AOW13723.1 histidine kinase [Hydrogenophaga crassostreae]OAD42020.1 histidine kinase [Hydrogenophaga crassostreae]
MSHSNPILLPEHQRMAAIERARQAILLGHGAHAAPGLAPDIERSWRRCLTMGHEPDRPVTFDCISSSNTRRVLDASRPLLKAAAPVVRTLTRAMLHTRYFAILTNADGVVIDVHGPVDRNDPPAATLARVGIDLSEATVGTTAIGTTLAEQQSVWLHRGEHFFQDNAVFSCAGAPIWGPDGRCVGMLDLTGVNVVEQPALKHLVTQSARSIENALTLAQPHRLLLRLNWPGRVLGDDNDGLVCLDADGYITGMNRPAIEMLCASPETMQAHADSVFALSCADLFDAASQHRGAFEVPLWSGLRLLALAQPHTAGQLGQHASGHGVPLKDHEISLIRKAVEDAQGNVGAAARALGISRATVYRRLQTKRSGH